MSITKSKLSKKISNEINISNEDSSKFVNAFFEIKKNFLQSHNLKISKFGSFYKKKSPQRIGRNPITLEEHLIPVKSKISFKASNIVKKRLN